MVREANTILNILKLTKKLLIKPLHFEIRRLALQFMAIVSTVTKYPTIP